MYILNPDEKLDEKTFVCGENFADYLVRNYDIPVMYRKGGKIYFAKTDRLRLIIKQLDAEKLMMM